MKIVIITMKMLIDGVEHYIVRSGDRVDSRVLKLLKRQQRGFLTKYPPQQHGTFVLKVQIFQVSLTKPNQVSTARAPGTEFVCVRDCVNVDIHVVLVRYIIQVSTVKLLILSW